MRGSSAQMLAEEREHLADAVAPGLGLAFGGGPASSGGARVDALGHVAKGVRAVERMVRAR